VDFGRVTGSDSVVVGSALVMANEARRLSFGCEPDVGVDVPDEGVDEKPNPGRVRLRPDRKDGRRCAGCGGRTGMSDLLGLSARAMNSLSPKDILLSSGVSRSARSKLCVPWSKLARSCASRASENVGGKLWLWCCCMLVICVGGVPVGVTSCGDEPGE